MNTSQIANTIVSNGKTTSRSHGHSSCLTGTELRLISIEMCLLGCVQLAHWCFCAHFITYVFVDLSVARLSVDVWAERYPTDLMSFTVFQPGIIIHSIKCENNKTASCFSTRSLLLSSSSVACHRSLIQHQSFALRWSSTCSFAMTSLARFRSSCLSLSLYIYRSIVFHLFASVPFLASRNTSTYSLSLIISINPSEKQQRTNGGTTDRPTGREKNRCNYIILNHMMSCACSCARARLLFVLFEKSAV